MSRSTPHPAMTRKGWDRLVREVELYEDAAAQGNTWGPEASARMLASLVIAGLRKRPATSPKGD